MNISETYKEFVTLLVLLAKHYHQVLSSETLLSSVPIEEGKLYPNYFRLAEKAGFDLTLKPYRLDELSEYLFPVILEMEDTLLLLYKFDTETNQYLTENGKGEKKWISREEIENSYNGKLMLIRPQKPTTIDTTYTGESKHWFWDSLKFSRSQYTDVFIASFLLNIFALVTPLFVRNVYDRVIPNAAFDTLYVLTSGIVLIYLFDMLFRYLRTYLLELAGKKSDILISSHIFEHILNMKLSHKFDSVGAFASNIREFDTLRNFLSSATLTMLIDIPFAILFLFVIYLLAGKIMLVPLIAGVLIILYGLIISRPLKKHIDKTAKLASWKNGILIESLSSLETIKSFGLYSKMLWKWEESVGEIAHTNMRSKLLTSFMTTFTNFIVQISNILVIILGVYAIHEHELTMGGLIAVTMLTSRVLTPLVQVSSLIINYEYAKSSYEILDKVHHSPIEKSLGRKYISRNHIEGKIEFKNVSFAYPGAVEPILKNITFQIDPGESVAILGNNGSGKSTILKLLMGYYEPTDGIILIDGIDIRQIDPAELRRFVNYIPQDITLFNGTIHDNLQYAHASATDEMIINSSKMSGLQQFTDNHPMGFDLPVQERGAGISGGQKQLIGLSRFFLRDHTSLLLLDEPTNALDSQAENTVMNTLQSFIKGKTTLIVSHKRNILQLCSRIIVLHQGQLAYNGPRDEVLRALGEKNGS
jgi:ATP-binding cassette subfamily C protein LapB